MNPAMLALLLLTLAFVALVAELFLPTHGLLALIGIGLALSSVWVFFTIDQYLGMVVLVVGLVLTPFLANLAMKIWPKTPVGKRLILRPVESPIERPSVAVGQVGNTVSELRPMGLVDFDGRRMEVRSELGMIPSGTRVRVVSFDNNKPSVRAV